MENLRNFLDFLPPEVSGAIVTFADVFSSLWWLWLFIFLFFIVRAVWSAYRQALWKNAIKWTTWELRIPRETRRTPKAMEQVFMHIHSLYNSAGNFKERWWDGEVTLWYSCEMVSFGGDVHMYMRVPTGRKNVIEAALYAQYPDIELVVAEDYVSRLPTTVDDIDKAGYNFFGNELRLIKDDEYPIRTYIDFEAPVEEKEIDPISATFEILAKLRPQETVWIQILFRPVKDDWKKKGEKTIKTLKEKYGRQKVELEKGQMTFTMPAPGDIEVLKAIDRNIGKPGFESLIRYIYFAPKEIYSDTFPRRGIFGAFNQYASESLNKFAHNFKAWTRADFWNKPHIFPVRRLRARKLRMLSSYHTRSMHNETWMGTLLESLSESRSFVGPRFGARKMGAMILNAEELATIYHLPTLPVLTGPLIKRSESKKVGPPAGLPIYGEGQESEKLPGI
ncbi:MAG: hypothetical protein Q8R29_03175 [bacterium]|nr:hypothetical protein [bacterium]